MGARQLKPSNRPPTALILGVGSFAHRIGSALRDHGAEVCAYLTRTYGHFPPSLIGRTFLPEAVGDPVALAAKENVDFVIPQSIDWAQAPWADALLRSGTPIFCPTGEAMKIERDRDFARRLCVEFKVPFPKAFVASNRLEAEEILAKHPRPFVIKNPLCSPGSPIHTILCETAGDTRAWLRDLDYAEGVFLQEYIGRAEAGHIVLISGGEIHSLVTNQEYKRAFDGNMGIVAGAPLGGLVERDTEDKYGLALYMEAPSMAFYYYAFYDLAYYARNLGMFMMTTAAAQFAEQKIGHLYLGTCYSENALYKTQLPGAEFFTGFRWSENLKELKYILGRDQENASGHLLETPEYRDSFYGGNLDAIAKSGFFRVSL
jgi:hypothetical protein